MVIVPITLNLNIRHLKQDPVPDNGDMPDHTQQK